VIAMNSDRSRSRKNGKKIPLAVEAIESRNLLNGSPLLAHIASAIDTGAHTVETQTRHVISSIDHSTRSLIDHHSQHPAPAQTADHVGGRHNISPANPVSHHRAVIDRTSNDAHPHHHSIVVSTAHRRHK
jgi:hypothetical protein